MARSGYTRSVYSAVTHLLSSYRNDEALRLNPLVSRHFDARDVRGSAELVRTLIRECIDLIVSTAASHSLSIAKRQRHILLRYDLEGASRLEVCKELGVTERQLYRDRRAASEALATQLRAADAKVPERSAVTSGVVDAAELALHAAVRMNTNGATSLSQERAEAIASQSSDPQWRIVAKCLDAFVRISREEYSEAERLIDVAEECLESNKRNIGSTRCGEMRPFFDVARARVAWANGKAIDALRLGRSGIDKFLLTRPQASTTVDPGGHVLLSNVLEATEILLDAGEIDNADGVLADVRRSIERYPQAEYLELEWRCALSRLQTLVVSDHDLLARDALETIARAQQLGLPIIAAEAASVAAWIFAQGNDIRRAKQLQTAALSYADAHDLTVARATTQAIASLTERKIGTPQRALDLAKSAVSGYRHGTVGHAYGLYTLAQAQLSSGALPEALESAQMVLEASTPREPTRAAALLIIAESSARLGERNHALNCVHDALQLLGRYGNSYLLRDARALRDRVA